MSSLPLDLAYYPDHETAEAISSKSYNAIMSNLVLLETLKMEEGKDKSDQDCVDFAAATTATLGVPSPTLSRAKYFDDFPRSTSDQHFPRKGDAEEEAELLRVLKLCENDSPTNSATASMIDLPLSSDENSYTMKSKPANPVNVS